MDDYYNLGIQRIWDRIERGIAAEVSVYNEILKIERFEDKAHFPSSHLISIKEEPPPLFTDSCRTRRSIRRYYFKR